MTSATLENVPIFPLETVLFPGGPLSLRIFEPRYVDMISQCSRSGSPFLVTAVASGDETTTHAFEAVGTLAHIADFETLSDGLLGIMAIGGDRARVREHSRQANGLYVGQLEVLPAEPRVDLPDGYAGLAVLLHELIEQHPDHFHSIPRVFGDASWIGYRIAELLPVSVGQKQEFLEMEDPMRRLELLRPVLATMHPEADL